MIKQTNPPKPSIAKVEDVDKQFFEMRLEIDTIIKNLATLTIYNWQSIDITDSLAFSAVSYILNIIKYIDDNSKSFPLYCISYIN